MLSRLTLAAGFLAGAVLAYWPAHYLGKREGRQQAAVADLESTVRDFVSRGKINGQVSASDAAGLCADLGLPDGEQLECVRRLREAAAQP